MSKTDRIFYHERKKNLLKNKQISIKIDLKDGPINDKLLNYNFQNFNHLLNNHIIPKKTKKLSLITFSTKNKRNKNSLNEISEDLEKSEIKFNKIELLTDSSFQETLANSSFDSQKSSKIENTNNSFDNCVTYFTTLFFIGINLLINSKLFIFLLYLYMLTNPKSEEMHKFPFFKIYRLLTRPSDIVFLLFIDIR